jgi:hypothetical protein
MLGLFGAHLILMQNKADRELFDEVFINLWKLVGAHPDLLGLKVLAQTRFGEPSVPYGDFPSDIDFPPMIREGLMALDAAQWNKQNPLKLFAMAKVARLRQIAEGPWTLFRGQRMSKFDTRVMSRGKFREKVRGAQDAVTETVRDVQLYLQELAERRGSEMLRRLTPADLRWTGLSPKEASDVLQSFREPELARAVDPDDSQPPRQQKDSAGFSGDLMSY